MKTSTSLVLVALAALAAGCSFAARSPEDYAKDTQAVLDTKANDIKACYDQALVADAKAAGKVTVNFTVKEETGELTSVAVDPAGTTAPASVQSCVTTALAGLKLAPPDANDGIASFAWDFQVVGTKK